MGNGMNKILPGLYVGNFRDAKDEKQLTENNITHIVSIHDNARKVLEDKEYLCIIASDSPDQDLTKFFPQVNKFIHKARLDGGNVLVHCLAGVSRSVTVTAAYIMTATELGWRDALNSIRGVRSVANPNFGFQKQLQTYESEHVEEERKRLKAQFPNNPFKDEEECRINLHCFQQYIQTGNLPSRSDDLYPLPHRAYEGHARRDANKQHGHDKVVSNAKLASKERKSGCRHRHHHHQHHQHHQNQHHHHKMTEHVLDKLLENMDGTDAENEDTKAGGPQSTASDNNNDEIQPSQEKEEEAETPSNLNQMQQNQLQQQKLQSKPDSSCSPADDNGNENNPGSSDTQSDGIVLNDV